MKKCKGCGVALQSENPKQIGYTLNPDQDYCQRCFRLTHYGDTSKLQNEEIDNKEIIKLYDEYRNDIFVLIVDSFDCLVLDSDNLLDIFKDRKVLLVINKIDLLPRSLKDDKLEDSFKHVLEKCNTSNIVGCLLTYKNDYTFNDLFFEVLNEFKTKRFVFVGRVNAGKTTLINKLLGNNDLTVSSYPGTTVNTNVIKYENYEFIDTPGLIDEASYINKLDKKLIKDLIPSKCVKPKIYQLYEEQSYFVEGLVRIDIKPYKNASITFYIKNEIEPHRTKTINADKYFNLHQKEFKLNYLPLIGTDYKNITDITYYLKGLGYIRIKGKADVRIYLNEDIKLYRCGVKL